MSDEDRAVAEEHEGDAFDETWRDGSPYRLRLVAHEPSAYDGYYNVVANPTLWFLQHYMWGLAYAPDIDVGLGDAWFNGYVPVNEGFASAIVAELDRRPDAAVFLHDYHLYLAPKLVREQRPDALLTHFIHIPWPETDYWYVLPARSARSRSTRACSRTTSSACTRVAGGTTFCGACEDVARRRRSITARRRSRTTGARRSSRVIRSASTRLSSTSCATTRTCSSKSRRSSRDGREFLVVRVDRTDPSKNVVRGFRAFALFLDRHPEMLGRVTMLALLDPSRQEMPEYTEYLAAIEREARSVNDRFKREGWLPVDLQIADNFAQSIAAYKQYDALLVNPVFDGLNLVSKEAPLVNERDGVLILSENAGSHEELGEWALSVNPFDIDGQAEAINEALTMASGRAAAATRGAARMRARARPHGLDRRAARQISTAFR